MGDMNTIGRLEKLVYQQSEVIHLMSGIIDEQFSLLMQYMTVEEFENCPIANSLKTAATLSSKLEE